MVKRNFVIKKIKNPVPWIYVISDLIGKKIVGTFYKKELHKTNQTEFKLEKVIKKGVKLYAKWRGYDYSFNSWVDKRDVNIKMSQWVGYAKTNDHLHLFPLTPNHPQIPNLYLTHPHSTIKNVHPPIKYVHPPPPMQSILPPIHP